MRRRFEVTRSRIDATRRNEYMSHAQKLLLASILMRQRLREAKIELTEAQSREWSRRVEKWCAQAQCSQPRP